MPQSLETTYRRAATTNARRHLSIAERLFELGEYPMSCFHAMTAIEEAGKLNIVRFAELHGQKLTHQLLKNLLNHPFKAAQAATGGLYINAGADRRHGKHPMSGMDRTSGVIVLARSGHWMQIRNACLYVDADVESAAVLDPVEAIGRDHAYYFICMAFEVLAEHAEAGLDAVLGEDAGEGIKFWENTLHELEAFMATWADECEVDSLEFLRNPDALVKAAEEYEKKEADKRSQKGKPERAAIADLPDFEGKVDKGSAWEHRDVARQLAAWLDGINDLLLDSSEQDV